MLNLLFTVIQFGKKLFIKENKMPVNNSDLFKKYKDNYSYFVETGTFQGDGVKFALEAGFDHIKSVELNFENYISCFEKFKHISDLVELYHGSSEDLFWSMIKDINEPIMFFFDSHYSGCGDTYVTSKGKTYTSLKHELLTLKTHHIKNHVIMVDDVRDFGTINMDFITLKEVIKMIKNINDDYQILFETGDDSNPLFKNDILVAII